MDKYLRSGEPITILVGNNFGRTTWVAQVPIRRLVDSATVPAEYSTRPVAERKLNSMSLSVLNGLVASARAQRMEKGDSIPCEFDQVLALLRIPFRYTLPPFLVHIQEAVSENLAIRAERIFWHTKETLGFRVFLPSEYPWRLLSGHADFAACSKALEICDTIVRTGRYPKEWIADQRLLNPNELLIWQDALACSRSFTSVSVELYVGLTPEQEREVFLGI